MPVPFRIKILSFEMETKISLETANKIAAGVAGVAAGTAVMAAGVALKSGKVIGVGGTMALTSACGTAAALGLAQASSPAQLADAR